MLRNGGHRSMHQGEDTRLRSGNPAASRERKHLALCINSQEEVRRYHRFCNHSGGQAVKQERSSSRRREEDFDNKIQRSEQQHLEVKATVIQRAWRAKQGQKKNVQSLTVPSSLRMTTTISAEQLKSLQSGLEQVDSGHFQLQSGHVTTDLDNMNMNLQPIETKVLIIQKAWRDFLQRQEVEKRSPSPPSLSSSSDKMSMSISMTTLSDGSTPAVQIDSLGKMEVDRSDRAASVLSDRIISLCALSPFPV